MRAVGVGDLRGISNTGLVIVMSSLTIRIGRTTRSELEEIAKARGQTVSAMVRALLEHAIDCSKSGEIAAESVSTASGRRA